MGEALNCLGICMGASSVSLAGIRGPEQAADSRPEIIYHRVHPHEGDPRGTLLKALAEIDLNRYQRVAATGRKFRHILNLTSIAEPEALEHAFRFTRPEGKPCPAVISAGGETFMVYVMDRQGHVTNVITGNKCASGTGEFFLQQLKRMNVSLEQAARWAVETEPYPVSGRCSVFCKSDCTHATNKGVPKEKVTAGLCQMMASKIMELLKNVPRHDLMLVGGTSKNPMMVDHLSRAVPGLLVPRQAPYFEALGAALWALENRTAPFPGTENLFRPISSSFDRLPPLKEAERLVTFKDMRRDRIRVGDVCLLGLDVGSTTTKAVLVRRDDKSLLASVYLRTNGDPVGASRLCYRSLLEQIEQAGTAPSQVSIVALGVCGSGRQIAGLHAMTETVINEIIAHATAAVFFDPRVDTIFEIGGQDAKYTYIINKVPADYAMNEACSAGTGSFLEESALETLGLPVEKIAPVALEARQPPNFNDQCAAFIASDIKTAIHEAVAREDIVAGLVYSICMNYDNRVKGNRPVGEKIFMQGGVCYNRAVPLAMAALCGKPIVVPPEPGLTGAFGAALEADRRITSGLAAEQNFDLRQLSARQVEYGRSFTCRADRSGCDRRCTIARIRIDGRTYPFGGACNRYENLRRKVRNRSEELDFTALRRKLVFEKYGVQTDPQGNTGLTVGINRSFLVNTYYPLYSHFFSALGVQPVLASACLPEGRDRRSAPFCYPAELAHGFFSDLIENHGKPDFIFLPHFKSVPALNGLRYSYVCPLVQGETFYLQTAFRRELEELKANGTRILNPCLDMSRGIRGARASMLEAAGQMGFSRARASRAFDLAAGQMQACRTEMLRRGSAILAELAQNPEQCAVVILGRPYNSLAEEAHMGIPRKLATRGILVLPMDFLETDGLPTGKRMYWGMGQRILAATHLIRNNPQLFPVYITNFSCGPDSFLLGYFRQIMGDKPSLTLELDSHTADAGLETRIEAFWDIVRAWRRLRRGRGKKSAGPAFRPARTSMENNRLMVTDSGGNSLPMTDERVTVLFPSMGKLSSQAIVSVFRGAGFNAVHYVPEDDRMIKLGRAHCSCKECLPLILTTGTLLDYIGRQKRADEILVYFMPTGSGPCRFGQYSVFMENLIKKLGVSDVALFSLNSDDGYHGLPTAFHRRAWWAVVVSDVFEDIRAMLLADARRQDQAMGLFDRLWQKVLRRLEEGQWDGLLATLSRCAEQLSRIPLKKPPAQVPLIALVGEIFVRREDLSRRYLTERLAEKGFAVICAPVAEWIHYSDHIIIHGLSDTPRNLSQRIKDRLKQRTMQSDERQIKAVLAGCGLVPVEPVKVDEIIAAARPYLSPRLGGEAVLTIGSALREVVTPAAGVIAIGPFGCMPNRLSEAILTEIMTAEDKIRASGDGHDLSRILEGNTHLPFLAIESDGAAFPQLVEAKLEAFCLRARRLHARMLAKGPGKAVDGS